ncbi:hypothetical protein [Serratia sp. NA_13]|uniref:hypothetical protein n=1 Tax=Serratia sp. NA_13 TaxID=3415658 RepID=UPI004046E6CD
MKEGFQSETRAVMQSMIALIASRQSQESNKDLTEDKNETAPVQQNNKLINYNLTDITLCRREILFQQKKLRVKAPR